MTEVKFNLTKSQMSKLAQAHKQGIGVTLQLNKTLISPNGIPLILTDTEYKKIQTGKTHNITISASRVKRGGFLPALVAALPTIASVIGGISGLTGIASNIKDMATKGKGAMMSDKMARPGCQCLTPTQLPYRNAKGFISNLGIPIISPLAKIIGLGNTKPRKTRKSKSGKALFLAP